LKHGDIIRVIWVDAHYVPGWLYPSEMEQSIKDPCSTIVSAGLFVAKTKTALIITRGISELGNYEGTLEIPLSVVKSTKILEKSMVNKL
jgi:hypothetical protein